ncbi:MAG: UDP-N-acetylmuramate dehydrogenase [Actinomycetota bacterium]
MTSGARPRRATSVEIAEIVGLLGGLARPNMPLAPLTTYRVGGSAAVGVHVESMDDLVRVGEALRQVNVPVLVVGRGSNVLVSDDGFAGVAVVMSKFTDYVDLPERTEGSEPIALFGGAVSLPVAARQSVARGLTGFEWAVGVPGSIGGAVRMNAGGHGSDMATSLRLVRLFHLLTGDEVVVAAEHLGLRFRGSALADHHVVLSATVELSWTNDQTASEDKIAEIVRWRRERQPGGQNAGSVFVNPVPGEVSAGQLIDEQGLRGLRIGSAEVSTKHANFIQADDGGRALDVVRVMARVKKQVLDATGYELRSEIRLVGFDADGVDEVEAVCGSEADTSVATIRLEQVMEKIARHGAAGDSSIPMTVLAGSIPSDGVEDVSEDLLDELREAFDRDDSQSVSRPQSRPQTQPSAPPTTLHDAVVEDSTKDPSRIVIEDDALRTATDIDFPADVQSQSVHYAPTSTRVTITDDSFVGAEVGSTTGIVSSTATIIDDAPFGRRGLLRRMRAWLSGLVGRSGNRRKTILVLGSGVLGTAVVALVVLASPIVAVRTVQVEGATYVDARLVDAVTQSLKGNSVLTVDTATAEARLEGDPWVLDARITTYLPNRAVIEISERIPVAWFLGVDNRARVIDIDGRVLAIVDGRPTEYLWIDGTGPNSSPGAIASDSYRAAGQLAMSIPEEMRPLVEKLGVSGPNNVTMTLVTGTIIDFGEPVDMRNKLVNVVVLLRRQDPNGIALIDVSSGTPVVKSQ